MKVRVRSTVYNIKQQLYYHALSRDLLSLVESYVTKTVMISSKVCNKV